MIRKAMRNPLYWSQSCRLETTTHTTKSQLPISIYWTVKTKDQKLWQPIWVRRTCSLFVSFLCHRFFQSCHRPSHTRWTASWGTSRTVKRTTAPNVQHGPAQQGCTKAAAAAPHLCLILCLLELLLSETLAHESGHTKATQGTSLRVTGIR